MEKYCRGFGFEQEIVSDLMDRGEIEESAIAIYKSPPKKKKEDCSRYCEAELFFAFESVRTSGLGKCGLDYFVQCNANVILARASVGTLGFLSLLGEWLGWAHVLSFLFGWRFATCLQV